jgi:hypothetical protein
VSETDSERPTRRTAEEMRGYCPVCGADVVWMPTAQLWPSGKAARSILPSHSGTCSRCDRMITFTVAPEPAEHTTDPTA